MTGSVKMEVRTGVVPEWCRSGAGMVPEWCRSGAGVVPEKGNSSLGTPISALAHKRVMKKTGT